MKNKKVDWTILMIVGVALLALSFLAWGIYTNYTLGVYN